MLSIGSTPAQWLIGKHLSFDIHHSMFIYRYSLLGPAIDTDFSRRSQSSGCAILTYQ